MQYHEDGRYHYYFMSLDADFVIDATLKGSLSRFINHSCEPNAETQKVGGGRSIAIMAAVPAHSVWCSGQ